MIIRPLYPRRKPDYLLLFMLLWLAVILLSCNVLKSKRSRSEQVDSVSRRTAAVVDTGSGGSIRKTDEKSKEETEWWRKTIQYPRDTSVINLHPTTIIYEGGKGIKETQSQTSDSNYWKNAMSVMQTSMDSLSRQVIELNKNKQTTPSVWLFAGIMAVAVVIALVTYSYLSKFKIVKRQPV